MISADFIDSRNSPSSHGKWLRSLQRWTAAFCRLNNASSCSQARLLLACEMRSEEHTSELQSRLHLVCRLLLEKKKLIMNDKLPKKDDTMLDITALIEAGFHGRADPVSVNALSIHQIIVPDHTQKHSVDAPVKG